MKAFSRNRRIQKHDLVVVEVAYKNMKNVVTSKILSSVNMKKDLQHKNYLIGRVKLL